MESNEENLLLPEELARLWACEDKIRHGLKAFLEVAEALHTIQHERLYREDFPNFAEYCSEKWSLTDRHARNLANAWEIAVDLDADPIGNPELLPQNERQARELKQVPRERRAEVWEFAVGEAGGVQHVCAHDVKKARESLLGDLNGEGSWHAGADAWAGVASQTFERDGMSADLVIVDECTRPVVPIVTPEEHALKIIKKHGINYAAELMVAISDHLREKGFAE